MTKCWWTTALLVAGGLCVPAAGLRAQAQRALNPACAKLLPASDVSKVSGDASLTLIAPGTVPAAGGTCNYALSGKTVILYVDLDQVGGARTFQRYKTSRSYQEKQAAIPGLGDDAFSAQPSGQDMVVARKGNTVVALLAMLDLDPKSPKLGKPHLTRDQLIQLSAGDAGPVVSREEIGR